MPLLRNVPLRFGRTGSSRRFASVLAVTVLCVGTTVYAQSAAQPPTAPPYVVIAALVSGAFTVFNAGIGFGLWRAQQKIILQNELAFASFKTELERQATDQREYREKVQGALAQLLARANKARSTFSRLVSRLNLDAPMEDAEYIDMAGRGLAELSEFLASASTHEGVVLPTNVSTQIRIIRSNCTKLFLELSSRHTEHEANIDKIRVEFESLSGSVDVLDLYIRQVLAVP